METVLGLSLTSTSVGWVLVEGRDAGGAILDHDDFHVRPTCGVRAVYTSEQASAAVLDAQAAAAGFGQRVRVVGVTWSDESVAEAALLIESLTDAGFDNVVSVRLHDACDTLARAIAPVVGYDQAAVCVVDGDSTIVVMVDAGDGEAQTAIKQLSGGPENLMHWLTALFDRSSWRPDGIVVVGADGGLDTLAARLTSALPVPVIAQAGAELALARGAALASAHSTEFTDAGMFDTANRLRQSDETARQRSYAGAVTTLAAASVTLVASLALLVGPHLVPNHAPDPVRPFAHRAAQAPIAEAPAPPPAVTPPARPAPVQEPMVEQQPAAEQAPVEVPAVAPVAPPAPPPPVAPPPEPPPNPHPLLTKLLQRLHGQDPDQQPPPPGAPTP